MIKIPAFLARSIRGGKGISPSREDPGFAHSNRRKSDSHSWHLFVSGQPADERVYKRDMLWFHRDPYRSLKSIDIDEVQQLAIQEIVGSRTVG